MSTKSSPKRSKAAGQKTREISKLTDKELQAANLEDLRTRFLNPDKMAGLTGIVNRMAVGKLGKMDWRPKSRANEFAMRFGMFEIAAYVGFISTDGNSEFWDETRNILETAKIEELGNILPFFALPRLLLRRLKGEHSKVAHNSQEAQSLFLEFVAFDNLFRRFQHRGAVLEIIHHEEQFVPSTWGGREDEFPRLISMLKNPEEGMWRLMLPRDECDFPTRALQELGELFQFCTAFSGFLNRCEQCDDWNRDSGEKSLITEDGLLKSSCWCYYGYWLGIIRQQFDGKLGPALGQFLRWASKLSDSKAKLEIHGYVFETKAVIELLTHPRNSQRLRDALGLEAEAKVAPLQPIKMPREESAQIWAEPAAQPFEGEEGKPLTL
jgi:hypothetical protein